MSHPHSSRSAGDSPVKQGIAHTVRWVTVDEESHGQRIDNFLLLHLKGVPKSRIYRILRKGEVRVNKGRVKPEYKLQAGDQVRIPPVVVPEKPEQTAVGDSLKQLLEARILYEDERLLIVNKPVGLAVHGGSGVSIGLIEALRQMRPQAKSMELVHRLDRDTSGCLLVAKRKSMLRYLQQQLRDADKGVRKRYLALVNGRWPNRRNKVDAPLKKNELQSGERMVRVDPLGRPSLTEFAVEERFADFTLLSAEPVTGRTHQIRVHAQFVGCSLVGDEKYGDDDVNKAFRAKGLKRLFLHAQKLSFIMPESFDNTKKAKKGVHFEIEAPLDDEWLEALAFCRLP